MLDSLKRALGTKNPKDPLANLSPKERLYHEVAGRLHWENNNISQEEKPGTSCDKTHVENLYARHYGLYSTQQELLEKIAKLEPDFDTSGLRQQLAYFEQYLGYIKAVVDCSHELMRFKQETEMAIETMNYLNYHLQQVSEAIDYVRLEAPLEALLDQADLLKDRYEDFPQRNIDARSVAEAHFTFEQRLELFQDSLEEYDDWFEPEELEKARELVETERRLAEEAEAAAAAAAAAALSETVAQYTESESSSALDAAEAAHGQPESEADLEVHELGEPSSEKDFDMTV